jgi:transcription initiation factor TFIID TATA-box-binding protein
MSEKAARRFARIVQKNGYPQARFLKFQIRNVVISFNIGSKLQQLQKIADCNPSSTFFEPEIFPGLKYTSANPKVTVLLFQSGKLVITGAKTEQDIHTAAMHMLEFCNDHTI